MSRLNLGTSFLFNTDIKLNEVVDTGATFRGRKIYCKAIQSTYPNDNSEKSISHGISTSEYGDFHIISVAGYSVTSIGFMPLNASIDGSYFIYCFSSQTDLRIKTNFSYAQGRTVFFMIFFTPGN